MSERLRMQRKWDRARHTAQTANERLASSQQSTRERMAGNPEEKDYRRKVPVNTKEWQRKPLRRKTTADENQPAKMQKFHGHIGYTDMLHLFRKISWPLFPL